MYIGFKTKTENFKMIHEYITKNLKGIRQSINRITMFTYYSIEKIDTDDLKVINYYIEKKETQFEILEYIV